MNINMLVVSHKKVAMHLPEGYQWLYVGGNKDKIATSSDLRDDVGENIAGKNANYSELTALYWAWKNLNAQAIGLVHYRRFFMSKKNKKQIASTEEIQQVLKEKSAILPTKRNYYIETTWSQYEHAHEIKDLENTREIIANIAPDYVQSFDVVMQRKKSHRFNMMIMKKDSFDAYCNWLFAILFQLEERTDISSYDAYNARIYGFISERLLDVWLEKNQVDIAELPVQFFEKINWLKKGGQFIWRKFTGKKRKKSNL